VDREVVRIPLLYIASTVTQQGEEKDSDNDNDNENGLRMRNEKEKLKEKRFSFFSDSQEEKRYANAQLAHCLLPDTRASPSQNAKSQIFPNKNY